MPVDKRTVARDAGRSVPGAEEADGTAYQRSEGHDMQQHHVSGRARVSHRGMSNDFVQCPRERARKNAGPQLGKS